MQPPEFAQRWRQRALTISERVGYQDHWHDLCQLVTLPMPSEAGLGQDDTFERHVKKVGTKDSGFADVFKAGFFIAECKGLGANLGKALQVHPKKQEPWMESLRSSLLWGLFPSVGVTAALNGAVDLSPGLEHAYWTIAVRRTRLCLP